MLGDDARLAVAVRLSAGSAHQLDGFAEDLTQEATQIPSTARQHVHVAMRHGLMGRAPFIDGKVDAVRCKRALSQRLGDAMGGLQQMGSQGGWQIGQRFAVHPRHHQDMTRSQWKRIHDGDAIIVLHHPAGREFAVHDATKDAAGGLSGEGSIHEAAGFSS